MKVQLQQKAGTMQFTGYNQIGESILMDAGRSVGGEGKGPTPMEVLLMSLGACSGIDVVLILNKQKQAFTDFKIDMNSKREDIKDEAAIFTDIHMEYQLTGEVEHDKAKRAVELSVTKYCSAYKIIASSAQITYSIKVNGAEVK